MLAEPGGAAHAKDTGLDQATPPRAGEGRDVDLLDFASGYGRVTRFLLGRVAADRLTVSDLMPEAVRFQRRSFGVAGQPG